MIPSKLKVVELRAELAARGLDTKGNKAVLVERLEKALQEEPGDATMRSCEPGDLDMTAAEDKEQSEEESSKGDCEELSKGESPVKEGTPETPKKEEPAPAEVAPPAASPVKAMSPLKVVSPVKAESPVNETISTPDKPPNSTSLLVSPKTETIIDSTIKNESGDSDAPSKEIKQEPMDTSVASDKGSGDTKEIKKELSDDKGAVKSEPGIKSETREERKRKRSNSPSDGPRVMKEDEPDINDSVVTLSWYDSDLNLLVDKHNFYKACPMSSEGFGYIWAGVRGTHAYNRGKVCYQVKLFEYCNVSHLEDEPNPNVLRLGWSALGTSTQLGEEPFSYGYGGTGKASVDCKFKDYGKAYGLNDVITAYLEFTETDAVISYDLNGESLGEAYRIPVEKLEGKSFAPHILSKNVGFEVNFGQMNEPWFKSAPGFLWLNQVAESDAVAGPRRPAKKSECEMIMMCGLPGCGKTYWANKYTVEHPEKMYNILGTNALIDKMKVMGLPRKGNYSGRWDLLIKKCTSCLQKLMDIGCQRRRNYILDQTNVYPAAQRRKMRNFEGFIRKAVVIVPTDDEFKRRCEKREKEEGKDVPDSAVLEMKANFTLPDKNLFDEVIYTELSESDAKPLVEKYNKEANAAGYMKRAPPGSGHGNKRFRPDHPHSRFDNYNRRPMPPSAGFRRGGGPPHSRGSAPGWLQRGPDRGWRDNRNHSSGGYRSGGGERGNAERMGGGGWRGGMHSRPRPDYERSSRAAPYERGQRGGGHSGSSRPPPSFDRREGGARPDNRLKRPPPASNYGSGAHSNMGPSGGGSMTAGAGSSNSGSWQWGANQYSHPPPAAPPQSQMWAGQQGGAWAQPPPPNNYSQKGYNSGSYGQNYGQQQPAYNQYQPPPQQGGGTWQNYNYWGQEMKVGNGAEAVTGLTTATSWKAIKERSVGGWRGGAERSVGTVMGVITVPPPPPPDTPFHYL